MKNLLMEIKQLAQKGMENTIISNDVQNKDIFLSILLKSEVAISKIGDNFNNSIGFSERPENNRTYERIDEELKNDMYLIAYCFSYYEHTSLYPQFSQDKAFEVAATKLGVKKTTLKNTRDWFDGHNDSHRRGWWQAPLPEDMQNFRDVYDKKKREDILNEARMILDTLSVSDGKNISFGQKLKSEKYHGKFFKKEEIEEFINIVINESPTIAKDLLDQCSKRTFEKCYDLLASSYKESTEKIAQQIKKYDSKVASSSDFSLWIRARFMQEIFNNNLESEALNLTK
ncbi:MAG: hypothetical protein PHV37_09765 [Candidatus Gastranaerophilales bacterium]|nr:hypothetical protein [Candidatus Gastranaerophilales bacterium]